MIAGHWEVHINNDLPLVCAADALYLSGTSLPICCGIRINGNNEHSAIRLNPARHINATLSLAGVNDALPLAGDAILLAGADPPLEVIIKINGNDLHSTIHLDPVLRLHDLDGKQNAEGIYQNKIKPTVRPSIHVYQVFNKGELMHDAISKQGDTWSIHMFNHLVQWYGLAESFDDCNDNKDISNGDNNKENSAENTVFNIKEDLLIPDKTSIFSLSTNVINLFQL